MAYYLVRFYSGSGERPPEQLIREVVDNELRPKLQQGGGLNRYITFIADDGRIGSASVYETKEAAQNGLQIAREWASSTDAMQGYRLSQTLEGEIAATIDADIQYKPAFGMARLFPTQATAAQVVQTIKQARAATQDNGSHVRTVIVQLPDGRVGSFAAYDSQETRERHTAAIRKARENPEMQRVLPNDPENIAVRIITSTG
ncbi:MAG: hypothetical protein QOH05_175 [Acetobacteraceae bacterium]|jgi:hypothetical protein|nr:hypothetical protein [Acetobacteraceae bacterium]